MPTITDNFIFRSSLPNFERDRVNTVNDLKTTEDGTLDIGHIVYVISEGIHYIYKGYGVDPEPLIPDNILDVSDLRGDITDIAANVSNNTLNIEDHESRIEELENDSNNYRDEVLNEAKSYTDTQIDNELDDYYTKTESSTIFATRADLDRLSNSYNPDNNLNNAHITWDSNFDIGNILGQTGDEIRSDYNYSQILDKILFKKESPIVTPPTTTISRKDGKTELIMEIGNKLPNPNEFLVSSVDGKIIYPWKNNEEILRTNGINGDQSSTIVIFNDNGGEVSSGTFTNPGIYKVYWRCAFKSTGKQSYDSLGKNNEDIWSSNQRVDSENYITYFITKPVTNHSKNDEKILIMWDETEMEVYLECVPSGQKEQSFTLPRPMKRIYVYNDIAGDYAESDTNHYSRSGYKYTYNSTKYGHRGAVKLKIVF